MVSILLPCLSKKKPIISLQSLQNTLSKNPSTMNAMTFHLRVVCSFFHSSHVKKKWILLSITMFENPILPVNVDANNSVGFGQSHGFRCFHHWQSLCRPKRDNQAGAAVFKAEPQLNPSSFVASCSTRLSRK